MVGEFATSKAGHDKSKLYVIVAEEGDFVFLCDGRLRTWEKPKKKRSKHIQIIHTTVNVELLTKLQRREAVQNDEIFRAVKLYQEKH